MNYLFLIRLLALEKRYNYYGTVESFSKSFYKSGHSTAKCVVYHTEMPSKSRSVAMVSRQLSVNVVCVLETIV